MAGPRRTVDGVTAEWDGRNWVRVDEPASMDLSPATDSTGPEGRPQRTVGGVTAEWDGGHWVEVAPKEAKSLPGFIRNAAESGEHLIGDVATGIGSAAHLIGRTQKAMFSPTEMQSLAQDTKEFLSKSPQMVDALLKTYHDRYHSVDAILDTLYEDPFGVAADVASVAGGTGAALKATPFVKTAQAFSRAAELTDPIRAAAKVGGAVASGVAKTGLAATLPAVEGGGFGARYRQAGDIIESGVYGSRSARTYAGRMDDLADFTIESADRAPGARITGQTLVKSAEGAPTRTAALRVRGGASPTATTEAVAAQRNRLDRTHIDPRLDRTPEGIKARFPKAGDEVGGRGVRGDTKGVREVPLSEIDPRSVPPAGTQLDDVLDLAEKIDERGAVKPLDVVLEEGPHPRVERGRVRHGALETLGQDTVPARVTVDPTKMPPDPYKPITFDESRQLRNQALSDAADTGRAPTERDLLGSQGRALDKALRDKLPVFALAEDRGKQYRAIGEAFKQTKQRPVLGRDIGIGGLAATFGANPVAAVGGALAKSAVQSPRTYAVGGIAAKHLSRLMSDPKMRAIILALRAKGISDEVIEATLSREGGQ